MGAEFGRTDGRGLDATRASQLVSLLQELDMNKYTRLFLRQEVDVDSLLTLSDADLKDMGVTALGARRKLTVAIHKHKLQQMSEKGGGGSTAIKAGGAAAALAAAAATAMKVKSTAAAGSSSAADATSSRRTEDVDGRTQGAQTHGFVVAGQVYRGRYLLNGKTYIGGSARVVLGEDVKTGQPIAVKVHSSRTYFAREMKLLRAMQSEYIVRFLDAFDEEDAPSAVVLEGGSCSLAELLAEGQLQPVERKHVLERLCLAVDFVHSRGFVLVDLKPANIVIFGSLLTSLAAPDGLPALCNCTALKERTGQAAAMLRDLAGISMVGGDVVEVSPPYDTTGATAIAGAHVAYELIALYGWTRRAAK
jgi:hypothetical protein